MNTEEKQTNTQVINVPCTPLDKAMARQLAQESGMTMSHVIREALKNQHKMVFSNAPTCATGQPCLCPTMHAVRPAQGISDHERVIQANHRLEQAAE